MECCGKAAAFVQRRRRALKGHYRSVWWRVNALFGEAGRDVAMECCGKAAAFVQRRRMALKGHYRSVWWCVNKFVWQGGA